MRGDAELGLAVHFPGPDLELDALLLGTDDGGMERAVVIALRRRDVVLEAVRHHGIGAVQRTERPVTVGDTVDHHAERHDVGELLEGNVLALHLAPYRIEALFAPRNPGLDPRFGERVFELVGDAGHEIAAPLPEKLKARLYRVARLGIELGERQVFELLLHVLHADALGERRVDVHRFVGDALTLGRVTYEPERAHVVEPVGELDQEHADIGRHGDEEFTEVLGLPRLVGQQLDLRQLGDAVDEARDFGPEHVLDLAECGQRILDRVVQQRGNDGRAVELQVGDDAGDFLGVGVVGVAGLTLLRAVRRHRKVVGFLDELSRGGAVVGPHVFE